MTEEKEQSLDQVDIRNLVKNCDDFPNKVYANYAEFSISNAEVFIDFYLINPTPGNQSLKVDAVTRVTVPHHLIKGFVSGLANMVALHEERTDVQLPNSREPREDDKVKIW
jgi:hypothetical protein